MDLIRDGHELRVSLKGVDLIDAVARRNQCRHLMPLKNECGEVGIDLIVDGDVEVAQASFSLWFICRFAMMDRQETSGQILQKFCEIRPLAMLFTNTE